MTAADFSGFRANTRATIIPNAYFTTLLPEITDPAELITSCYVFFALGRQRGFPRAVSEQSLAAEVPLMRALSHLPGSPATSLRNGLEQAVTRGILLRATPPAVDGGAPVYVLNTDYIRRLLGNGDIVPVVAALSDEKPTIEQPPMNIYALYEENIGPIPPLLFDALSEAEQTYPHPWVQAAFLEAVALNRRNWRYISRILERWKLEGPNYETSGGPAASGSEAGRRSLAGRYRHLVHRAPNA